jgi:exonuclease SbcC
MIPVELALKNFLAYRDPGLLRFEGMHIACLAGPNGAGKSSLLDALTWALWGKARTNSPDELIHQGQKEMRVTLTFDQGGSRYRVMRQRKSGKRGASLLELQAWDPTTESWRGISEANMRGTQQKIENLLRLDYETFVNSAFLVQGRADEFTTKTPGQRKQVLANILGLSRWEVYEKRAKERISETKAGIQRLDGRLEEIERELARRESHEGELKEAENGARQASEALHVAEERWADIKQTRQELVSHQRQIDDLTRQIAAQEKEIQETERELETTQIQANTEALQAAREETHHALLEFEPLQKRQEEVNQELAALVEKSAHLEGVNRALGPETEPMKERIDILKAATEPECPTCGQALTEEHREQLVRELSEEVESRRAQYRDNRERINVLKGQVADLEGERKSLAEQLNARPALEKRIGELETALAHAGQAEARVESLTQKLKRWKQEQTENQEKRHELERHADEAERQLRTASLTQADVDKLRLEKRLADERVGGARQQLAALDAFAEMRVKRLAERDRLAEALGLYQDLREAFSKRGVPAMIIETAVPELERTANDLLARMTDGRMHVRIHTQREIKTGELREALDIVISDELGSRPYEMYSGGEAFRINFAIRIALSRLLARRAGAQLRSLFIDEGFGTQDARGREHLIAAINSIQDDFDRILVITHIDELKDAFPARIEVTKTSHGSEFRLS